MRRECEVAERGKRCVEVSFVRRFVDHFVILRFGIRKQKGNGEQRLCNNGRGDGRGGRGSIRTESRNNVMFNKGSFDSIRKIGKSQTVLTAARLQRCIQFADPTSQRGSKSF